MKRLSLLAVSMLLTCTLFAADIFLRGSVNGWGASDTWTLVGDMPPFPVAWTAIPAFDLQTTDGVIYTLVADDVDMPVETFQYGFRKNHTEEYAPLEEKYKVSLPEGVGSYKVEITLDFTDATNPHVDVKFTKNVTPTYDYYIAGNGDGENGWTCGLSWVANGCGMENGQYIAMVKPGTYEFKITNGFWDDKPAGINWGAGAVDATLSTPGYEGSGNSNVKFTVESDAKISVTFDGEHIVLTSDVPFVSTTVEVWSVVGDASLGLIWDPKSTTDDMEFVGGAYQLVKTGLSLEAGTPYSYKFTANHQWGVEQRPNNAGNATLTVTESGTYKVTFYLSATAEQWGATPEKETPTSADEAVEDSIYATNGTVFCSTPFEVYNLVGQNVTAQNGSLFGIYIVKTANTVKTVSVK